MKSAGSGPFGQEKDLISKGGIRVPLIAVWNGVIPRGSFSDKPVSQIDLYPTFLEAAGIKKLADKVLDGQSLLPLFRGEDLSERALFWHFPIYLQAYSDNNPDTHDRYFRTRPGSIILQYPWKLHEYFEDGRLELYNLELDIREETNLANHFPDKVRELHTLLNQWRNDLNAPVPETLNPYYKKVGE